MFETTILRAAVAFALLALAGATAQAKPEFAKKENVNCVYCHTQPGGPRNFRGMYYHKHDHSFAEFDELFEAKAAGVQPKSNGEDAKPTVRSYPNVKVAPALGFTLKDVDNNPVNLGRYQGKVVMLVNVASKCGFTPQYTSLEKIYEKYKDRGFVVLAFPSNDFGQQEPGSNKEIKEFCSSKYNVTFPLFSKIAVKGDGQAPLYKFLTDKKTDPMFSGPIEWNFTKFLVDRNGELVARFKSPVDPGSADVTAQIEKLLAAPAADKKALQ